MKRAVIAVVLLVFGLAWGIAFQASSSNPPRFETWLEPTHSWETVKTHGVKAPPKLFDAGNGWQREASGSMLFMQEMTPLGRLTNGLQVAWSGDQLLCAQEPKPSPAMEKARSWLNRFSRGWIRPLPRMCRYWLLDPARNTTVYIGQIPHPGFPPDYIPSPDFQHGFVAISVYPLQIAYCFDLPARRIWRWDLPKKPLGWWDNTHLLYHPTNDDVCLYDVVGGKTSMLVATSQVGQFLGEHKIARPARPLQVRPRWSGRKPNGFGAEFFLARGVMRDAVAIHIIRPDGRLELVPDSRLKFELDDSLRSSTEE